MFAVGCNFLYEIVDFALGALWSDKWIPGYEEERKFKQYNTDDVSGRIKVFEDEAVETPVGSFTVCRHLVADMQGGLGYWSGHTEFWYAEGVGLVKFLRTVTECGEPWKNAIWLLTEYCGTGEGFFPAQDGFFRNTNLNEYNDRLNEAGARMRLMWQPSERLTFDLTSDYQYTNQNGFPYGLYNTDDDTTADPSTTTMNGYRRQMVNTGLNITYAMNNLLLTSTTSHQYLWDRMDMDQDYVEADYMHLKQEQKMNAVTQELVLRSHSASRWQHATGLFGAYQWLHTNAPVTFGDAMGAFIMSQWGMPAAAQSYLAFQNNRVPGDFRTPQLNLGVYHESNISLTDRLKMTLGLRYDYNQVKITYDTSGQFDLAVSMGREPVTHSYLSRLASSDKHNYQQLLPKFGLTFQTASDGSNLYAFVSKGFRAGGYNLQMFSEIFQTEERGLGSSLRSMMAADYTVEHTPEQVANVNNTITYQPEESWNFELGTHQTLFGGKVKADAALFYTQIRNQQLSVMGRKIHISQNLLPFLIRKA